MIIMLKTICKMTSFKLLFVTVLALFSFQCKGAEIPKSETNLDLRLFVENGAAVVNTLYNAVSEAMTKVQPNLDLLVNELAPELKEFVKEFLNTAKEHFEDEKERTAFVFSTLTKALDDLKPTKTCADKVSPDAKKWAQKTEKDVFKVYSKAMKKHEEDLNNLKVGLNKTLMKLRKLFDDGVPALVKCLTPGNKQSKNCVNDELKKALEGTLEVVGEAAALLQVAEDVTTEFTSDFVGGAVPVAAGALAKGKSLLDSYSGCVGTLKS